MSLTITGLITILLSNLLGDAVPQENVAAFIDVAGLLIGLVVAWYGRYRQGDIDVFGRKL